MKKYLILVAVLVLTAACSGGEDCTIKGTVPDDVKTVLLIDRSEHVLDSSFVSNGEFRFVCDRSVEEPVAIKINRYNEPVIIIPDSKEINVKINAKDVSIKGSKLSKEHAALEKWAVNLYMTTSNQLEKLFEAGDTDAADALVDSRDTEIVKHCKPIFKAHKADYVGVLAMVLMQNKLDKKEFLKLYDSAGDCVKNDFRVSVYHDSLTSK